MANRFIRGTYTRNAWDFYEVGTAFAFAEQFTVGATGLMLINNGVGGSYLDIYRTTFTASLAGNVFWATMPSGNPVNPQDPQTYFNSPCQLDLAGPPGLMVAFATYTPSGVVRIREVLGGTTYDSFELAAGGPFVTLPPNYGLAVLFSFSGTNATVSSSIWYQSVTDHTPPAN